MVTQERVLCYSSHLILYPVVSKLVDLRIPLNLKIRGDPRELLFM